MGCMKELLRLAAALLLGVGTIAVSVLLFVVAIGRLQQSVIGYFVEPFVIGAVLSIVVGLGLLRLLRDAPD